MDGALPVYTISLPEYTAAREPDYEGVGRTLDAVIAAHFTGRIALRGLSLADHPGRSREDVIATIIALGTDRYDPDRKGVLHDFYAPYGVDLHALPCTVSAGDGLTSSHCAGSVMAQGVADFYTGPPADRGGPPLRLELLLIYDRDQLEAIPVPYDGHADPEPCEFRFRRPDRKPDALLGIVSITS